MRFPYSAFAKQTGQACVIAQSDGDSYDPMISGDGRYVIFRSLATNLVASDTNGAWDIFVHDRQSNTTEQVSVATGGGQADADSYSPSISDDGRFVVFQSKATNLVPNDTNERWDIFLHDHDLGTTTRINGSDGGQADIHCYAPAISGDSSSVAFESNATNLVAGNTHAAKDLFVVKPTP